MNFFAYAVSVFYVSICLLICFFSKKHISNFIVRKLLHIFMANWWYIRLFFIKASFLWLGPTIFAIILNVYARNKNIKSGMDHFCISLSIMTLLTELSQEIIWSATAAILVLGYADAAAALVGTAYKNKKGINTSSTIWGSFAFFVISFVVLVVFFYTSINLLYILLISVILTIIESKILPKYDNITVPTATFLMTFYIGNLKWL